MSDKNEDYYYELLDKFLAGNITKQESTELRLAAKQDSNLQSTLSNHIEARANIRIAGEADLKKKLMSAYDDLPTKSEKATTQINPFVRWAAIAASVIGLAFGFYYFSPNADPTFQLANHLTEVPALTTRGVQANEFLELWGIAKLNYQNKEYKETIAVCDQLKAFPNQAKAHAGKIAIFKGMTYLQLKQYSAAISHFNQIPENNPLANDAKWYIALTYLDSGDIEKSRALLKEIANDKKHYKHSQATTLLKQL